MTAPVIPVTYTQFITDFPEFSNATNFPEAWFNFLAAQATLRLRLAAWADLYNQGFELYIAHHLSVRRKAVKAAMSGGDVGVNTGPIASKAVDKVSASFDTGSASLEGAGFYNLTVYGTEFYQLAQMVGIGGAIISGSGIVPVDGLSQWQGGWPTWYQGAQ